jgi:hypothetical protein
MGEGTFIIVFHVLQDYRPYKIIFGQSVKLILNGFDGQE